MLAEHLLSFKITPYSMKLIDAIKLMHIAKILIILAG